MPQYRRIATKLARTILATVGLALFVAGCGSDESAEPVAAKKTTKSKSSGKKNSGNKKDTATADPNTAEQTEAQRKLEMRKRLKQPNIDPPEGVRPKEQRTFTDLLEGPDPGEKSAEAAAEKPLDEAALATAGLRKISGKYLTLITDLPPSPAIDELPRVFDLAVPQWVDYFKFDKGKFDAWQVRAVLMKDKTKFKAAGLYADDMPDFLHGYARAKMIWLYEQTTDYYRRHLLLHEGTHAAMFEALGRAGPPWYAEGMAEYVATHHWDGSKLMLRYFPKNREETPGLGRIKIVRDGFTAGKAPPLAMVMAYDALAHRETEPYAWSWAAVTFMASHPKYRERFPKLLAEVDKDTPSFTVAVRSVFDPDVAQMQEEWQLYVAALEHAYDFERTVVDFTPGQDFAAGEKTITVAADHGWQNSGLRLAAGTKYQLTASGRYQVAKQPRIWWCEPGGVSIRYYQGKPLGILLAAVRPDGEDAGAPDGGHPSALLQPTTIGLAGELAPGQAGTLYFKINDSAGELSDNAGTVTVNLKPGP